MTKTEIRRLACNLMGHTYPVPGYKKRLPNGSTAAIIEELASRGYVVSRPTVLRWFHGGGLPKSEAAQLLKQIKEGCK